MAHPGNLVCAIYSAVPIYIYIYLYVYIYIYVQCIFFCLIYGFTIKSQFSTSSKVVDANQQRLSATWLQQAVFSPVVFLPSREVFFAPEGLGADPRGSTPMSRFFQEFVDPKKAKLSKSIIQSSSQSSCKCRDSLKLCHLHHIFIFVHSHLAVLPCAEPLTALDPFQQRKASGPGSCGKSVAFLVRIWDTLTPNKTIQQPLVVKPLTRYKACQELIHSCSVNPAVSC